MDDAEKYLKRTAKAKQQQFSNGYISSPIAPLVPSLPAKKKRKRDPSEEPPHQPEAVRSPPPPKPKAPQSLLDRFFPGNSLKEATLQISQVPPPSVVRSTVERLTQWRERVIFLRAGVEDLSQHLLSLGYEEEKKYSRTHLQSLITAENWHKTASVLQQFCHETPESRKETIYAVQCILKRKDAQTAPPIYSIKRWHEFLNTSGPESGHFPSVSFLLWLSNSSTTALFTVLTQRLLRGVTVALEASHSEAAPLREEDFSNEDSSCEEETGRTEGWLTACQPCLSSVGTKSYQTLLVFLRLLMPSVAVGDPSKQSSGYGVWLLAAFVALDVPLDPDTDRLAHKLFRKVCEQVRIIAEWKGVQGDVSGELLQQFRVSELDRKTYESMDDITREDLLALYTLIVTLATFFRQNQNHLIPL